MTAPWRLFFRLNISHTTATSTERECTVFFCFTTRGREERGRAKPDERQAAVRHHFCPHRTFLIPSKSGGLFFLFATARSFLSCFFGSTWRQSSSPFLKNHPALSKTTQRPPGHTAACVPVTLFCRAFPLCHPPTDTFMSRPPHPQKMLKVSPQVLALVACLQGRLFLFSVLRLVFAVFFSILPSLLFSGNFAACRRQHTGP